MIGRGRMAVLALAVFAGACGKPSQGSIPAPEVERTVVEIDNRNFADMNIYVIDGAQRVRIGSAPGLRRSVLTIPARIVGIARDVQFVADPVGSDRVATSQTIHVRQGDRVSLRIPAN